MELKIIEAGHPVDEHGVGGNWGKFGIARFDEEWFDKAEFPGADEFPHIPLLRLLGWGPEHVWVLDLQTGEGALFRAGGHAGADLNKRRIWVCPMYEPFLTWLWDHARTGSDWYERLPRHVELPDAPFAFSGYRRSGRCEDETPHEPHEYFDDPPTLRRECPGVPGDESDHPTVEPEPPF